MSLIENTFTVKGRITDPEGLPLAGYRAAGGEKAGVFGRRMTAHQMGANPCTGHW